MAGKDKDVGAAEDTRDVTLQPEERNATLIFFHERMPLGVPPCDLDLQRREFVEERIDRGEEIVDTLHRFEAPDVRRDDAVMILTAIRSRIDACRDNH